jgi:hypothetical protein
MGKTIQIRVDESLSEILSSIQREVANVIKEKYNLEKITIHGTVASQILAAKSKGRRFLKFKINKTGINKGMLKLTPVNGD